jgi:hypothetical protein
MDTEHSASYSTKEGQKGRKGEKKGRSGRREREGEGSAGHRASLRLYLLVVRCRWLLSSLLIC